MSDKNEVPEISVDEIMTKIREEVSRRKQDSPSTSQLITPSSISAPSSINTANIRSLIAHAAANADAGATVTPMEQFSGPKQKLALFIGKVVIYLASFITDKQRRFNSLAINSLQAITDTLEKMNSELAEAKTVVERQSVELVETKTTVDRLGGELVEAKTAVDHLGGELVEAKTAVDHLGGDLVEAKTAVGRLGGELVEAKTAVERLGGELVEAKTETHQLKLNILDQQRRLTMLLEEARKRLPDTLNREQIETLAKEEDHMLDAMYVAFEDRFRGTREDIKSRLRVYLPYLEKLREAMGDVLILDVGCGRGEWLELVKENGYTARGIDLNRVMIQQCEEFGFEVVQADVIEYLRNQKTNSHNVITAFQVIEHLPFKVLIALFDECLRVLKPGGLVIFETPNPENLIVGACNFYYDPTHRTPLPPPLIQFISEIRGFTKTEIVKLHKLNEPEYIGQQFVDELLNRVNMEQDYSIIGYKS